MSDQREFLVGSWGYFTQGECPIAFVYDGDPPQTQLLEDIAMKFDDEFPGDEHGFLVSESTAKGKWLSMLEKLTGEEKAEAQRIARELGWLDADA